MADVRERLGTGEPLDLLAEASGLLAALDPRQRHPFSRTDAVAPPSIEDLVTTFVEVERLETSALLAAIAVLAPDELLRARARRAVGRRRDVLPAWLVQLDQARIDRCVEMVHTLGDGDDLIVGVHLAGDHALTVVVYVDHNLGTVAKDAFVVPLPLDALVAMMREHNEAEEDTSWRDLDSADCRARLTEAIEAGAATFPPFESESWPACRPLVEWVARLLPEGGTGYERPAWDDAATEALADAFFASPFGAPLDTGDHRSLFSSIVWFATDYGPGDPLRWSPTAVEILLTDWLPRKVMAPAEFLAPAPELLRAFVSYCHDRTGVRAGLTADTLAALDSFAGEYQEAIRAPRPQGPAALLAALGREGRRDDTFFLPDDDDDDDDDDDELEDFSTAMLAILAEKVGGAAALEHLEAAPLPDEAFSLAGIADDVREIVAAVAALCDRCCDELLDVEYRTACRRLLARVARGDVGVFRRSARSDTAAAAICWIVGRANDLFSPGGGKMRVRDLLDHFGITNSSVSPRAASLLVAAGLRAPHDRSAVGDLRLGTPELLVSATRRRIIERRDHYRA